MTELTPITAAMPMSSPADYYDMSRVRPEVAVAMVKINELGQVFASRAKTVDDEASFPTANYRDPPCVREVVRCSTFPLFLRWAG
jgi:hypothetical protein